MTNQGSSSLGAPGLGARALWALRGTGCQAKYSSWLWAWAEPHGSCVPFEVQVEEGSAGKQRTPQRTWHGGGGQLVLGLWRRPLGGGGGRQRKWGAAPSAGRHSGLDGLARLAGLSHMCLEMETPGTGAQMHKCALRGRLEGRWSAQLHLPKGLWLILGGGGTALSRTIWNFRLGGC